MGTGKPNATGRSSGRLDARGRKTFGPPKGERWVWLTVELLSSPGWRARSVHCARLLDFLLIEHRAHGGLENGNLKATYKQLAAFGISGRYITRAIRQAELLGLVRVKHGGRWAMTNKFSIFTLTFYATGDGSPPTHDWKRVTSDQIADIRARLKSKSSYRK